MEIQIKFENEELEDMVTALNFASTMTRAPGERDRWHILFKKIKAIFELKRAVEK